ncbi:N-alpha-acetyltransferase 38, NatC auxiliary subunit [Danio aesculapii]|uniref:N-alpha-acetyltransferase 38, NatC auxiliary subunit n=1 Tax=Danio aesculapii TaxID=1142201 RepID=UPI0024C02ADB|nr:N-alpha-acetyltransferase 38, NatC auxiliary subunit [Danio aesculapii]
MPTAVKHQRRRRRRRSAEVLMAAQGEENSTQMQNEFFSTDSLSQGEPRVLGLAMIPGHHVVSIEVETESLQTTTHGL